MFSERLHVRQNERIVDGDGGLWGLAHDPAVATVWTFVVALVDFDRFKERERLDLLDEYKDDEAVCDVRMPWAKSYSNSISSNSVGYLSDALQSAGYLASHPVLQSEPGIPVM